MAIYKEIQTDYGFPLTHWKATAISIDYLNMKAQSTVLGYANKEAMDANKVGNHLGLDTVLVNLYWKQEELNAVLPKKSDELKELEEKQERDEEEEARMQMLLAQHSKKLNDFLKNNIVINDELKQAFVTILKYQHQFHLQGEKLAGGSVLQDNTEEYDNTTLRQ